MIVDNSIRSKDIDLSMGDLVSYRGDICLVTLDTNKNCFVLVALEGLRDFEIVSAYDTIVDVLEDPNVEFVAYSDEVKLVRI